MRSNELSEMSGSDVFLICYLPILSIVLAILSNLNSFVQVSCQIVLFLSRGQCVI